MMKHLAIALMIATTPIATSCASLGIGGTTEGQITLRGTQALLIAEHAYNGIGNVILPLLQNGTIKGDAAARVRVINRKAIDALMRGKAAVSSDIRADAAAEVMAAIVDLETIRGDAQ